MLWPGGALNFKSEMPMEISERKCPTHVVVGIYKSFPMHNFLILMSLYFVPACLVLRVTNLCLNGFEHLVLLLLLEVIIDSII